jgi:Flp pilus assembly protein TadG
MLKRFHWQDGQYLVLLAVLTPVMLAIVSLAIDVGITYIHRRAAQNAADSAAMAGASVLCTSGASEAEAAALQYAKNNDPFAQNISSSVSDSSSNPNYQQSIQVTVDDPYQPLLAQIVGVGKFTIPGQAAAGCTSEARWPVVLLATNHTSLSMTGANSIVVHHGNITVNSSSRRAVDLDEWEWGCWWSECENTIQTDTPMAIVGGYVAPKGAISPTPVKIAQAIADPMVTVYGTNGLPAPGIPTYDKDDPSTSCPTHKSPTVSGGVTYYTPCGYDTGFNGSDHDQSEAWNIDSTAQFVPGTSGTFVFNQPVVIDDGASVTFGAGIYVFNGGLALDHGSTVTFGPGTYIFQNEGLDVYHGSTVKGSGVFLYFTDSTTGRYWWNWGWWGVEGSRHNSWPTLWIQSGSTVSLTPQTSGNYASILVAQGTGVNSSNNAGPAISADTELDLSQGVLYFPSAELTLYSWGDLNISFIASQLQMIGGVNLTIEGYAGQNWQRTGFGLTQ